LVRFVPSFTHEPYNLLLAVSEAFTVLLVLIRKPGQMASTPYVWAVAVVGTCAPLFVMPEGAIIIPPAIGAFFMFAGLLISLSAKLFLNRSFGIGAANRGVKSPGPYRLVRHPMYLGSFITQTSFLLLSMSIWNVPSIASAGSRCFCVSMPRRRSCLRTRNIATMPKPFATG